ncbi:hypothetical protein K9E59_009165 [Staphylococcus pseudintermedius]|nr:hypothetical protein K9E58_009515 [Staphylococcus pseudintermedius]USH40658.1 hypothetical protein K9E59_009165 [Staphylococcus pseudintermedius]USJ91669.1 hypothetical protein K9E63_09515 [Staphylococcus pseudintermedius]USL83132.1 hypothetical protein K9E92_14420 [Staphylococcus pseudintermedius]UUJ76056.1 hypothetical protein K9E54_009150 [Staphylococcus pseudintermedius]
MANANSFKEQVSKNEVQETNSEKPKGPRQQVSDLLERMAPEIQKGVAVAHVGGTYGSNRNDSD